MGIFEEKKSESKRQKDAGESSDRIFQKFCREYGSPNCRDIIGYDKKDLMSAKLLGQNVKFETCIPLIKKVTKWILEELNHSHGV